MNDVSGSSLVPTLHHVVDRALQSLGQLATGLGRIEGIALRRGGVEAHGYQARALQHLQGATPPREIGIGIGGDEQFGEIADYEDDVLDVGECGEELEQPIADGSRNEEGVAAGEEFLAVGAEKEDGLDAQVVDIVVAVHYPKPAVDGGELVAERVGHLGEVDEPVYKAGAGDKLLEIRRDGCACGQNHGLGDRGRGQTESRQRPVDNGQLHAALPELGYLLPEDTGGGGPREEDTSGAEHLCCHQLAEGCAPLVDGKDARDKPTLQVVFVGGDELHALIEGDFGLGGSVDGVHLLAVDTDGGDSGGDSKLVQPAQKIVKTYGLASVFFQAYDGQAPIVA